MMNSNAHVNNEPFSYQPLGSRRAIRLIKFLPGPTPKCQMFTVEVEKAPPYAALSYTWGSKTLERKLQVDGCEIAITKNLAEAIDGIFVFVRDARLAFWADSICINQRDVHERGRQVQLMSTIYRSAEFVSIWLGPERDDSDFVIDKIKQWKEKFDELKLQCGGSDEVAINSIDVEDSGFFGAPGSPAHRVREGFRMICRRSWWRRVWIVPEGTVASPTRTLLFCGNRMMNWECLRAALQITHHVSHYPEGETESNFGDIMAIRLDVFRKDREAGGALRLLQILGTMRSYECEDPRDKVYASLGMAMDVAEDNIVPDYTKPCTEVFCDVVRFSMSSSRTHSLDFLGHAFRSCPRSVFEYDVDDKLPSWVPDWKYKISFYPLDKYLESDSFVAKEVYDASGSMPNEHNRIQSAQLHLQGSIIDCITKVWDICEWNISQNGLECERSWMPTEPESKYHHTGETLMEVYNHTLLADVGRLNYSNNDELSRGVSVDRDKSTLTPLDRQKQSWMLIDIKSMTYGRRLFQTSRGFLGLGAAVCGLNDDVCVLFGGQVLYVLRERSNTNYEFIGECYLHGMMDGQALEDESFSKRMFVIV